MAEYIDREIAAKGLRMAHDHDGEAYINAIPAADVVEVVRCKDCKHSYEDLMGRCCAFGACVDCIVPDDFFCAYGAKMDERSEEEDNV